MACNCVRVPSFLNKIWWPRWKSAIGQLNCPTCVIGECPNTQDRCRRCGHGVIRVKGGHVGPVDEMSTLPTVVAGCPLRTWRVEIKWWIYLQYNILRKDAGYCIKWILSHEAKESVHLLRQCNIFLCTHFFILIFNSVYVCSFLKLASYPFDLLFVFRLVVWGFLSISSFDNLTNHSLLHNRSRKKNNHRRESWETWEPSYSVL